MGFVRRSKVYRIHHEPVLGTVFTAKIVAPNQAAANEVERCLLSEINRLEAIFSVYNAASELNQWKRGEVEAGPELSTLLSEAATWQRVSGGVFNPAVGVISARWRQAEADQSLPEASELAALVTAISTVGYAAGSGAHELAGLNFNAFAKGRVVDLATTFAHRLGKHDLLVNIGGDLRHIGRSPVVVGVEDPNRAYDNVEPFTAVELCNQGMATSGLARRGFRIDGRWFSHVIDPRTGWPVNHVTSASVVASDAATADALATVLSVLPAEEGFAWLAMHHPSASACVIDSDAVVHTNAAWDEISRPTST